MLDRLRMRQNLELPSSPVPLPRLWMVLLVLAVPFIVVCADCLESLERSGSWGAVMAPPLLPSSVIGYLVLVFSLKQRNI